MIAVIGDSANLASIGLHRAMGFSTPAIYKSVGLKFGRWLDTVLMQKTLGEGDMTTPEGRRHSRRQISALIQLPLSAPIH